MSAHGDPLSECTRCGGLRTVDASLFKIASLSVGANGLSFEDRAACHPDLDEYQGLMSPVDIAIGKYKPTSGG